MRSNNLKIAHINASDIGSTGKIVMDISQGSFMRGWETIFLFPKRHRDSYGHVKAFSVSGKYEQGIYRRIYYILGLKYGFAPFSTNKILKHLKKEKPDVVHLHSINCATVNIYRLLNFLKRNKIPTVVTNHAEFFYTGSCAHAFDCERWKTGCGKCPSLFLASDSKLFDRTHTAWKKMKQAFCDFENIEIVSVSPWVYSRALRSPILKGLSQSIVLNGVDIETFKPSNNTNLLSQLKLGKNLKIIVHVTAHFSDLDKEGKGGAFVFDLAKKMQNQNYVFVIVGPYHVEKEIPNNIRLVGAIYDQKVLAEYYNIADLCLVTSRRETFGMAVAESLCCGTPVVGFKSGGSESIAMAEYTQFVNFGDVDRLKEIILVDWANKKAKIGSDEIAQRAKLHYAASIMANQYCNIYEALVRR